MSSAQTDHSEENSEKSTPISASSPLSMTRKGDLDALFSAALAARRAAYAPYSNFAVGAALRTASGAMFSGANVENAAYPVGACAEAGAISAMVLAGERRIEAVLVVGDGEPLVTPCGACRQRIREFAAPGAIIHIAGLAGLRASFTLADLLPHAFGPSVETR